MKLVIATPLYPPEPGGPATYAKILEEELPKRGWEVEMVKFKDVRALPKIRRHIAYMRLVYRAAKKADAVLALDPVSVGLPALWAARFARRPFFARIAGDYAWEQGTQRFGIKQSLDDFVGLDGHAERAVSWQVRMLQRVQRRVARGARRVIVPSEYLKKVVVAWGVRAEKISVVYNAGPQKEAETAAHLAVKGDYLLTIARLVPWKGIADGIRALGLLRAHGAPGVHASVPDLNYVVVGDGPERDNLSALARDLGLGEAVSFVGALPHADARAYLHGASAFVLPTRYEGLSHAILEAFVEGVPVVTTPVGGNVELVTEGETGLLAPYGNAEALAEAIGRVLNDRALRDRVVAGGKEKAATFTRERMVEGTMSALAS